MAHRRPVAVIGGGLTGLAAATHLRQAGIPVVLYEAGPRVGGVIRSVSRDGFLVECGPQVLREGSEEVTALIDAAGLGEARVEASRKARRRFILRGSRLVPVPASPLGAVTTPLLTRSGKLRVLAEPWLRSAAPGGAAESVAGFVTRRFGAEVRDALAEPFVSGVWAGDADQLAAQFALPEAWRLERDHGSVIRGLLAERRERHRPRTRARLISFSDGLEALPRALAAKLGTAVRCNARVERLERVSGGWRVGLVSAGGRRSHLHRAVIYAGSARQFPEIRLRGGVPAGLPSLPEMPHASVAVVGLGFHQAQVGRTLSGWGFLVPAVEDTSLLGAIFSSSVFGGRAPAGHVLITALLGGARDRTLTARSDDDVLATALQRLAPLLRLKGNPVFSLVTRLPLALPQYDLDHGSRLAAVAGLEGAAGRLVTAGSWCSGTGLPAAIRAGEAAARRIMGLL